jgi:myo-inositol-1(or 4)-monophosphatase
MKRATAVLKNCADIRRIGSAALDICWVACGRLDAYYESVQPWDAAAAGLIAREAGATLGHLYSVPVEENPQIFSQDIVVTTPALFDQLKALLLQADDSSLADD